MALRTNTEDKLTTRVCITCLKLAKIPKFLLWLKFFSNCTQSISQSLRNSNKLISCSVTVKCFLLTQSVTAINFKTSAIAYSVSGLVVYLVLLLYLSAAVFYFVKDCLMFLQCMYIHTYINCVFAPYHTVYQKKSLHIEKIKKKNWKRFWFRI